ncbi:MAG: hypothetical protein ACR2ML_00830 [Solirubrobacteraceae bacterium]
MSLRRPAATVLALALVASLAACGKKHETIVEAETEGIHVDVGGLTYQVQVSRELNALDVEDQAYLKGRPPEAPPLAPTESWFGVFLRVANEEDRPARAAEDFQIHDTTYEEGQPCLPAKGCYEPVQLDVRENVFAYAPSQIDPDELYPTTSSAALQGVVQGSVLVFRIPYAAYDNRPLELKLTSPGSDVEGTIVLDL